LEYIYILYNQELKIFQTNLYKSVASILVGYKLIEYKLLIPYYIGLQLLITATHCSYSL